MEKIKKELQVLIEEIKNIQSKVTNVIESLQVEKKAIKSIKKKKK